MRHMATRAPVAAFFDLDKTIIATSSAYAFGKEFLNNGLITRQEALDLYLSKASYMLVGHSSEQMDASRDQLAQLVKGWDVDEVRRITTETMHNVVTPAIYREARELIEQHRAAGHDVIIISASADILVEPIAAELGVDTVVATEVEVEDGKLTGTITQYLKGEAKAAAVETFAREHGYELARCYAYSDSATDIPMLAAVGNPVAVNPDRALRKHDVVWLGDPHLQEPGAAHPDAQRARGGHRRGRHRRDHGARRRRHAGHPRDHARRPLRLAPARGARVATASRATGRGAPATRPASPRTRRGYPPEYPRA